MAEEPQSQSIFGNFGLLLAAVLLAITATHQGPIPDIRPIIPETGPAAAHKAVVYAQLWQDPFQAVDIYFRRDAEARLGAARGPVDGDAGILSRDFERTAKMIASSLLVGESATSDKEPCQNLLNSSRFLELTKLFCRYSIDVMKYKYTFLPDYFYKAAENAKWAVEISNQAKVLEFLLSVEAAAATLLDQSAATEIHNFSDSELSKLESKIYGIIAENESTDVNRAALPAESNGNSTDPGAEQVPDIKSQLSEAEKASSVETFDFLSRLKIFDLPEAISPSDRLNISSNAEKTQTQQQKSRPHHTRHNPKQPSDGPIGGSDSSTKIAKETNLFKDSIRKWQVITANFTDNGIVPDGNESVEKFKLLASTSNSNLGLGHGPFDRPIIDKPVEIDKSVEAFLAQVEMWREEVSKITTQLNNQQVALSKKRDALSKKIEEEKHSSNERALADNCGDKEVRSPPDECLPLIDRGGTIPKVIAVMVDGGSFEGDAERRRQLRYGVITALEISGYRPQVSDRVFLTQMAQLVCVGPGEQSEYSYKECANNPRVNPCIAQDQRGCVPFEEFELDPRSDKGNNNKSKRIIILWLRDDNIFRVGKYSGGSASVTGYERLKHIAANIYPQQSFTDASLAVIGPPNSMSLEQLFLEVSGEPSPKPPCSEEYKAPDTLVPPGGEPSVPNVETCEKNIHPHPGLHMFDYSATEALVFENGLAITPVSDPEILLKYKFPECRPPNQSFCFSRTGSPDAVMAIQLGKELRRRGLQNHTFRTVLLVDGASTFANSMHKHLLRDLTAADTNIGGALPEDILSYRYYTGLDGHLTGEFIGSAGEKGASQAPAAEDQAADRRFSSKGVAEIADHAEGSAQLDYIQRLGSHIGVQANEKPVGLIGIIGTDVYDKLAIVRELRHFFPHALMFTTSLNARMADRDFLQDTRGLIVASNFGLEAPSLTTEIRSTSLFRDDYQTAGFLTARYVVDCDGYDRDQNARNISPNSDVCSDIKRVLDPNKPTPIFAIGDSGRPNQLTPTTINGQTALATRLTVADRTMIFVLSAIALVSIRVVKLYPHFRSYPRMLRYWKIMVSRWNGGFRRPSSAFWWATATLLTVIIAMVLWTRLAYALTQFGEGDGLGWTDGLSLWPAVWCQLLGCTISIWLISAVLLFIDSSKKHIEKEFKLKITKKLAVEERFLEIDAAQLLNKFDIRNYWNTVYARQAGSFVRLLRAGGWASIAIAIVIVSGWIYPADPILARGALVRISYAITDQVSAALVIFLSSLVFDATLFSGSFVRKVRKDKTYWPRSTLVAYIERMGFCDHLEDWIDLQLTSKRTTVILRLVWCPFIAIAIFTVSKILSGRLLNGEFMSVVLITSAMLIWCVVALRNECEKQRATAIETLRDSVMQLSGNQTSPAMLAPVNVQPKFMPGPATKEQLLALIDKMTGLREGGFASALQLPIIKAILVPIAAGAWPVVSQYLQR